MKKVIIIYAVILFPWVGTFCFVSCGHVQKEFKEYEFATEYYCPDSLQGKMNTWITETVKAADQHFSAGECENPEDVVIYTKRQAEELFRVRGEGLFINNARYGTRKFIPQEKMTPNEIKIFNNLKPKSN